MKMKDEYETGYVEALENAIIAILVTVSDEMADEVLKRVVSSMDQRKDV